jgi:hypothetical protein
VAALFTIFPSSTNADSLVGSALFKNRLKGRGPRPAMDQPLSLMEGFSNIYLENFAAYENSKSKLRIYIPQVVLLAIFSRSVKGKDAGKPTSLPRVFIIIAKNIYHHCQT